MKKLLILVSVAATLLVGLSAQSQQLSQVYIVYVRSGDAEDDKKSMEALQYTVNSLNTSGGRAAGYNYNLHDVPTIADAIAFTASRSQNGIAQVEVAIHGVYAINLNGQKYYSGNVRDTTGVYDESELDDNVQPGTTTHCDKQLKSNDDIGVKLANRNGHKYRKSDGTVTGGETSGNSGPAGGNPPPGTEGHWTLTSFYPVYYYYPALVNGEWITGVVITTVYAWVFTSEGGGGNQQLASVTPLAKPPHCLLAARREELGMLSII
jgi:hypothetical protein